MSAAKIRTTKMLFRARSKFEFVPNRWFAFSESDEATLSYDLCSFCVPDYELPSEWGYHFLSAGNDQTTLSYDLCSFCVPDYELPSEFGYYFLSAGNDRTTLSYDLCSFSVPEHDLPFNLGYYFLSAGNDRTTLSYDLCSFSVPENELEQMFPEDPTVINSFRNSIYGVNSGATSVLPITQYKRATFSFWEILTSTTGNYQQIPTFKNSLTCYLSGVDNWYDASVRPLTARMTIGFGGKRYKTSPIALKPYSNVLDIPNLQLWLDATDPNALITTNRAVISWLDKSPNSLTATQTISANRPTLSGNIIKGLSAVSFDGNDFLTLSTPVSVSGNFSSFFVYNRSSQSIKSISLGNSYASDTSPFLHWSDNFIYSGNERSNSTSLLSSTIIASVRKNEGLLLDGSTIPFTTNWGGTKHSTVDSVGRYSQSHYHQGMFGEYIQANCLLPDNELELITRSLSAKWK